MSCELLTSDNHRLSRVTNEPEFLNSGFAITCTASQQERIATYIQASLAPNTRLAYTSDTTHFHQWGGSIPASAEMVAAYLADNACGLSVATLSRRLAALSKLHKARDLPNPTETELVKMTMRGIKRVHGVSQRQARALMKDELFQVLDAMGDSLRDKRDKALLLIGFSGGFRRSELVALNVDDIEHVLEGIVITIRKSKTDQMKAGRKIGVSFRQRKLCPVAAVDAWLERSEITEGAIFRSVDRHGNVGAERLTGEAVSAILRERMAIAGLNPKGYSGHSLRAGFVTNAALSEQPLWKVRRQTGHMSDRILERYVRSTQLFDN
ncbi:MAG: tyrosine-type recombinase/integrase [Pseudomonadota bacterium]